jgi:hypothetical protein
MAIVFDPSPEQLNDWNSWVRSRPESVRSVATKLVPWRLYRIRQSGHRATLYSFTEHDDGKVTCTMVVSGKFNLVAFERRVFDVDPDDLEECDLPSPDEALGSADLSIEQCKEILNQGKNATSPPDVVTELLVLRVLIGKNLASDVVGCVERICDRGIREIERLRAGLREIVRTAEDPLDHRSIRAREILRGDKS